MHLFFLLHPLPCSFYLCMCMWPWVLRSLTGGQTRKAWPLWQSPGQVSHCNLFLTITCFEKTEIIVEALERVCNVTNKFYFKIKKIVASFQQNQIFLNLVLGQMATFDIHILILFSLSLFLLNHRILLFLINFYWSIVAFQCVLVSTVQQSESAIRIHMSPFLGFPSHLGHHRTSSRAPCVIQQVVVSYLFYTQYQECIYVNPNLPIPPTLPLPHWYPYICSLHLCLYFCFVDKIIYTIFLDFTYVR